jgi:hypothetical protein
MRATDHAEVRAVDVGAGPDYFSSLLALVEEPERARAIEALRSFVAQYPLSPHRETALTTLDRLMR